MVSSTPALVGRDDALRRLNAALVGNASFVVVEGEAGIGKTRVVRDAIDATTNSRSPGDVVLLATCPPVSDPSPLGALTAAIRRLDIDPAALDLSALGGALRPLFPEWSDHLPATPEPLEDASATRHRLFLAFSELIACAGVDILVVEDLHWSDTATVEWLLTLCAEPSDRHARAIIVTFRPWELPSDSLLPRLTGRAHTERERTHVELLPLGVDDVQELVASMYGMKHVSTEFASFLHETTGGIPFVIEEYLHLLEDREDIIREGDGWSRRGITELRMPASVRESVLERLQHVDAGTRNLLEAASILPDPADETMLAAAADIDVGTTRKSLPIALHTGFIREAGPQRYGIRHVLAAQAISGAIPVPDRRRMHARVAATLTETSTEAVDQIAFHYFEAGDFDRWSVYAERSAERSLASGDDRSGVELLLHIVETAQLPLERHLQIVRTLGHGAFAGASALGGLAERVVEALYSVLMYPDLPAKDRGEVKMLLGRMLWATGRKVDSFEQFEGAIDYLGHDPDLACRAMANMALPLIPEWPAARHRRWLERAQEAYDHAAPAAQFAFREIHPTALLLLGDPDGWDALEDLPGSARNSDEHQSLAKTATNAAWASMVWGRFGVTRDQLDKADHHIAASDYDKQRNILRVTHLFLAWYTGAWDGLRPDAKAAISDDGTDLPNRLQARQILGLLDVTGADVRKGRQTLAEVRAEYDRLGIVEPATTPLDTALARLYLHDGDLAAARGITLPRVDLTMVKGVCHWLADIAPVHLKVLLQTDGVAAADDFVTAFRNGLDGMSAQDAPAPFAALTTCTGIMEAARGQHTAAAHRFNEAAEAWATIPRPYDELLAREHQGVAQLAAGDIDKGTAVLGGVQQRLQSLGARWDADRVAHTVREHGGAATRTWRGGRRGYGDQLSPREAEVVQLVVDGMTNRDIAEALFLSRRTVEGHVRSAMRKHGVNSRTALAIAAVAADKATPRRAHQ